MYRFEDTHWWFVGKRAFVSTVLDRMDWRDIAILDVGCGTGGMMAPLARWGQVTGLDISSTARAYARRRGLTVRPGSANRLPFADLTFDMVTFFDVLYHKGVDERVALLEARRVLKSGGYVLITDCAIPWLWGPHDKVMGAKRRYYKHKIEKFIEEAGFTIHRSSYIFFTMFPLFVVARLFAKIMQPKHFVSLPHPVVNRILIAILKVEAVVFRWVNFPIGSSVLVLGQKR